MRGYSAQQRQERKEAPQRAVLDRTAHEVILEARAALVRTIEQYPTRGLDPRALRAVAVTGLFSDLICALAGTTQGLQLLGLINQQIEQAGLRLVPVRWN
jgi:hypothetical protein